MGGVPWLVVWICLAGCLCSGLEDPTREYDYHFDYKFDNNYIAMKKAASGMNIPNPDVIVMYGMEAAGLYYAVTHRLYYLCLKEFVSNSSKMYTAVLNGACVHSPSREHDRCLTEREARTIMLKEARLALYSAAAFVTETSVRTRLQWFIENGVDDLVSMVSADLQSLIRDVASVITVPVINLLRLIAKFKNILVDRYTSGTGNPTKMVATADAIYREVLAIWIAIISKHDSANKFYQSTQDKMEQYNVMFQDHLEAVLSMPEQEIHQDSPYPFINRYWDARALEYAITWIFKMRKEVNVPGAKEFDEVLQELYTKLSAGKTEESLRFVGHILEKMMDRLGYKIFSKYLMQPMHNEISRLLIPVPVNFEDLNPLGVPRSLFEAETSTIENLLHRYLDEAEEDSVTKLVFSQLVSMM